ncbi:PstS family phosphate ABC transporter substrate-binding protein [uncultured Oscillibacter sp.]|uniref:PstS family phosphate ABC transporter substrate-binding protein n=1 Tax=uncultured Oscillibacter sp. TaxID=876091 RepID=UPI0025E140D8|nr:substrate-binding domain-containing protein [uncultured Oscillibacter sp.]
MKKLLASALACLLLCQGAASAAGGDAGQAWSRPEGDGSYVTIRVPGEPDMALIDTFDLAVRYADTGEPVALSSAYLDGYLFATVPAENADRPLEVFRGDDPVWTDLREQYLAANGSSDLQIRGVVRGDNAGRLKQDAPLTRAEGAVLMARLLDLQPAERPGYSDVSPDAWYHEEVSAAAAAGLFAADGRFLPDQAMTRAEFTVLLARALSFVGWLDIPAEGNLSGTGLMDAESVPSWAAGAYQALFACNPGIAPVTEKPTGAYYWEDAPVLGDYAEPENPITRGEAITSMNQAMRWVPCYPTEAAIQFGLDREMPVIDGSTSTYPYTQGVYSVLFTNGTAHPQFPKSHSKSFASYERLIRGEADVLFAATKASAELESLAAEQGVELQYIPIAYDAMVFFTNLENPVNSLTRQQIQDIYVRNAYSSWDQVGGPEAKLLPYCRNTDSGSHALMERYFLEDGKLSLAPEILQGNVSVAMSSALTDVASALSLDPPAYAIGYSVYAYYGSYEEMMTDVTPNKLKLLAVDGVLPTAETIADGTYPLADYNYLVLRSDEPKDSPARRLAEFMVSDAGQQAVADSGFLPLAVK